MAKVVGKIEALVGEVKILGVDGVLRDATVGEAIHAGEQIVSTDPGAQFEVKYLALEETSIYEGIFRVLADGSVIAGVDAMESIIGDEALMGLLETAEGEEGADGSSAYIPNDAIAESSVQGFSRGSNHMSSRGSDFNNDEKIIDTNDFEPTAQDGTNVATEDDLADVTGQLVGADLDGDAFEFVLVDGLGEDEGTLTLNPDGSYIYNVDGDFQDLAQGETRDVTFTYKTVETTTPEGYESEPATVTITVTGTNDAPVIESSSNITGTAFEGLNAQYYGVNSQIQNLAQFRAIVDANEPDATFRATDINYGDVGVTTGGLTAGSTVSTNESLQTFLKADAHTLSEDPSNTSDGGLHMVGQVYLEAGTYQFQVKADDGYQIMIDGDSVAEVSNNQSPTTTTHDYFTIDSDGYYDVDIVWWDQGGEYIFQPELSSDGGDTYQTFSSDNFDFRAVAPVSVIEAGTTDSGAVVDGIDTVSGQMVASDVDNGAVLTWSVDTPSTTYGIFAIDSSSGEWTFTLNNALATTQALVEDQVVTETFSVVVTDEHGASDTETVTVKIQGMNDAPVLTVANISATEDGTAVTGTPSFTDVDVGDTHTYSVTTMAIGEGLVTINPTTGVYTYDVGSDFQSLAEGATQNVTFDVTVTDNNGASDTETVTVTVTGTNDQPIVQNVSSETITGSILLNGDTTTSIDYWNFTHNGGDFIADMLTEINNNGNPWIQDGSGTYTDINGNGTQEALDVMIRVYELNIDGTRGSQVGVNDDNNNYGDDGSVWNRDSYLSINNLAAGNYQLVVGAWDLDSAEVDSGLNTIDHAQWHYEGPYQITLKGDNGVQLKDINVVFEATDGLTTFENDLPAVSDDDTSDTHIYELVTNSVELDGVATANLITINSAGHYVLNGDFNYLAVGETATVTFQYTADDQRGFDGTDGINENSVSDPKIVTITVQGTNDAPVANIDNIITNIITSNISVHESALLANDTDIDGNLLSVLDSDIDGMVDLSANDYFATFAATPGSWTEAGDSNYIELDGTGTVINISTIDVARSGFGFNPAQEGVVSYNLSGWVGPASNGSRWNDGFSFDIVDGEVLSFNITGDVTIDVYQQVGGVWIQDTDGVYDTEGTYIARVYSTNGDSYSITANIDLLQPQTVDTYTATDGSLTDDADVTITQISGTVLNGTAGDEIILGAATDDTINGNGGNDIIDGGDGTDTLVVTTGSFDLSNISNIEIIELQDTATIVGITASDVISMTDGDNELIINGDATNTVSIDSSLTLDTNVNNAGYDTYTGGGATLLIETPIDTV